MRCEMIGPQSRAAVFALPKERWHTADIVTQAAIPRSPVLAGDSCFDKNAPPARRGVTRSRLRSSAVARIDMRQVLARNIREPAYDVDARRLALAHAVAREETRDV